MLFFQLLESATLLLITTPKYIQGRRIREELLRFLIMTILGPATSRYTQQQECVDHLSNRTRSFIIHQACANNANIVEKAAAFACLFPDDQRHFPPTSLAHESKDAT